MVALLEAEATSIEDSPELDRLRRALNDRHDAYVRQHGPLNRFTWRHTGRFDPETGERPARVRPRQGGFRSDPFASLVFDRDLRNWFWLTLVVRQAGDPAGPLPAVCDAILLNVPFPHLTAVRIEESSDDAGVVRICARAQSDEARCPACGNASARVHAWYERQLADAPVARTHRTGAPATGADERRSRGPDAGVAHRIRCP